MFIISSPSRERSSFVAFYENELVNFAVYAIAYSDLKMAPFDRHETALPFREKLSQTDWPNYIQGLERAEWEAWIAQIAHSQQLSWLTAHQKALNNHTTASPVLWDMPLVMNGHPGYDKSLHELYLLGVTATQHERIADDIETYDNPIDYWGGSSAVKEQLVVLWNRYRVEPQHSRVHFVSDIARSFDFAFYRAINDTIRDVLGETETFLPIFFVQYLVPVFYNSGSSLILGMPNEASNDDLLQLLGRAVRDWMQCDSISTRSVVS